MTKEKESRHGNFEKRRTRRKVQFKVCLASLSTIITAIITSWAGAESNNFSSFHPIFYLLFISKIPEKIVVSQVLAHLFGNNLFEQFQSSFCPIDSQENSLCKFTNDLLIAADSSLLTIPLLYFHYYLCNCRLSHYVP